MSKNFLYRVLSAAILFLSLVFYLLIEFKAVKLDIKYKLGFFIFLFSSALAVLNLVYGIIRANRINLFAAAFLLSCSFIYLNAEFFKQKIIVVMIMCAALFALSHFLFVLLSGGVYKYDADNDKDGYKDYKTRLAEKELQEQARLNDAEKEEIKIKSFKDEK